MLDYTAISLSVFRARSLARPTITEGEGHAYRIFVPCYIDAFFPEVGIATLELLERLGHEVVYPRDQTCCGQPMANSGFNADCAATEALFVTKILGIRNVVWALRQLCSPYPR